MCSNGSNLWPLPTKYTVLVKELAHVNPRYALFQTTAPSDLSKRFLNNLTSYFTNTIDSSMEQSDCNGDYILLINLIAQEDSVTLNWETPEAYRLQIVTDENTKTVTATIEGSTVFGVRHGIETLLQLLVLDVYEEQSCFVTLKSLSIEDQPVYKHRGLLIDSARNYLSTEVIKKVIIGMAMSKMNVLHWHITDTQSFPFISSSVPNMSKYGAYHINKTYSAAQIKELIDFAFVHGVRIIPEIDGPAHAGNGWQWGPAFGLGNLVVCYNQQPYRSFCIQPPCGQMNPANPNLYRVLQELYTDIVHLWTESDVFHMGGDEVYIPCWNSSEEILNYINSNNRSEEVFLQLWAEYQRKALDAFDLANNNRTSSVILWTSTLTDPKHIELYLPKDRYVIQTWVPKSDTLPGELEKLGYRLIVSTKDSWYLDHGFWGSTTYYKWQTVYDNAIGTSPAILGGEVCMWGELVDDNNIESKIWPRAAAAAERLWSNPVTNANLAKSRFFSHNDRLKYRNIRTSPVTPEYCSDNDFDCINYL